jgi:hypothetical protein
MRAAGLTRPGRTLNRKEKRTVDNRQSKPTGQVPSEGAITYNLILGIIATLATIWVGVGIETRREMVGALLGMFLALGLLAQAAMGMLARSESQMRARRHALEAALKEQGYTAEDGLDWLARQPGSPTYKPGPY